MPVLPPVDLSSYFKGLPVAREREALRAELQAMTPEQQAALLRRVEENIGTLRDAQIRAEEANTQRSHEQTELKATIMAEEGVDTVEALTARVAVVDAEVLDAFEALFALLPVKA